MLGLGLPELLLLLLLLEALTALGNAARSAGAAGATATIATPGVVEAVVLATSGVVVATVSWAFLPGGSGATCTTAGSA